MQKGSRGLPLDAFCHLWMTFWQNTLIFTLPVPSLYGLAHIIYGKLCILFLKQIIRFKEVSA